MDWWWGECPYSTKTQCTEGDALKDLLADLCSAFCSSYTYLPLPLFWLEGTNLTDWYQSCYHLQGHWPLVHPVNSYQLVFSRPGHVFCKADLEARFDLRPSSFPALQTFQEAHIDLGFALLRCRLTSSEALLYYGFSIVALVLWLHYCSFSIVALGNQLQLK